MTAAPYPWQQPQWQRLQQARSTDRLPHALLIHGPQGAGLHAFAEHLAIWLLCTGAEPPCGDCKDCRLFAAMTHPDLIRLQPEEEGKQIRIEAVRDLIDFINLKSHGGGFKLALITPAEAMNRNAANALLKTLEEPPPATLIMLLTHQPLSLPITLRSRAQNVAIDCQPRTLAVDWLGQQQLPGDEPVELCLELCGGGPLRARDWIGQGHLALRGRLLADLDKLRAGGVDPTVLARQWLELDSELLYRWNRVLLQDLARLLGQTDTAAIRNQDLLGDLQALAKRLDLKHVLTSLDLLNECQQLTEGQGNLRPVNLLETFMLHWSGCLQAEERKVL